MKTLLSTLGVTLSVLIVSAQSFAGPLVSVGGRNSIRGVYVQFNSVGTGIDQATFAQYLGLVEFAKTQGLVMDEKLAQKGREGEVQACVVVDGTIGYRLIKVLAPAILQDRQNLGISRTEVYVGQNCDDVSAATSQDLEQYLK